VKIERELIYADVLSAGDNQRQIEDIITAVTSNLRAKLRDGTAENPLVLIELSKLPAKQVAAVRERYFDFDPKNDESEYGSR
jgi:hypothetical protein